MGPGPESTPLTFNASPDKGRMREFSLKFVSVRCFLRIISDGGRPDLQTQSNPNFFLKEKEINE